MREDDCRFCAAVKTNPVGGRHLAFLEHKDVRVMAGPIVVQEGVRAGMKANYFLDTSGKQLELAPF